MAQRLTPRTLDVAGSRALKPRPLRCFLRQGTLLHFAPPHPGVKMGNGRHTAGGSSNTPRHASCYGNRCKLRPCGPLASVRVYLTLYIVD